MVAEAEKYKEEDEKQTQRIGAKNALESYAYNMKSTVEDEKLKGKIDKEDKTKITGKCKVVIEWFASNQVGNWFLKQMRRHVCDNITRRFE